MRAALTSVFMFVLIGTYAGIGALAHDLGFSVLWAMLSTLLVWAAPGQVILITALGGGARLIEVAIAVGLSGVRMLPMVVALLPLLRRPGTRNRQLILPAHLTAVSMWIEALRLVPTVPRGERIAFCNGIGVGMIGVAATATGAGFYLAASLPALLTAALLFLTPLSFLMSIFRNSEALSDRLALALGLVIGPVLAAYNVGLDLMWTGLVGGTLAYGTRRLCEAMRG